jgi:hypothetical protein
VWCRVEVTSRRRRRRKTLGRASDMWLNWPIESQLMCEASQGLRPHPGAAVHRSAPPRATAHQPPAPRPGCNKIAKCGRKCSAEESERERDGARGVAGCVPFGSRRRPIAAPDGSFGCAHLRLKLEDIPKRRLDARHAQITAEFNPINTD